MFTEKHYFDHLSHQELDAYLARGWYRMGQAVFTCRFLMFEGQLYSAIWIRLPLANYSFRKSLRKIKKKVEARFQVELGPVRLDLEKERLYQRYRRAFPGRIAPTLQISLMDDSNKNLFDTQEIRIYDGRKLVAFSFFDLGTKSVASILGVYDPEYASYSLGFYTMIREMEFAIAEDKEFFYPGYVVPGYQRFDYKLRIGTVDYYNERLNQWEAYESLDRKDLPTQQMYDQLKRVQKEVAKKGLTCKMVLYPPYEANLLGYWILDYLEFPLVLQFPEDPGHADRLIVAFNHLTLKFHLYHCSAYDDLSDIFLSSTEWTPDSLPYLLKLMIKEEQLAQHEDPSYIAEVITSHAS